MVATMRALAAVPFSERCHWRVAGLVTFLCMVLLGLGGAVFAAQPQIPSTRGEAVDFVRDVLPILEESCHACHVSGSGGQKTVNGVFSTCLE